MGRPLRVVAAASRALAEEYRDLLMDACFFDDGDEASKDVVEMRAVDALASCVKIARSPPTIPEGTRWRGAPCRRRDGTSIERARARASPSVCFSGAMNRRTA